MDIQWKKFQKKDELIVKEWILAKDKKFLCMEKKSWSETANDIEDCLKLMKDGQFKNVIGCLNNEPVCAVMFGVEFSGDVLRLYNIVVDPNFRNNGIAKQFLNDIIVSGNKFDLKRTYKKITTSTFPENEGCIKALKSLGFKFDCKNDGYLDFSIDLEKELVK